MTAQRSYDIGLVNKVVPDEELMPTAMKIAEPISGLSPWALGLVRQARLKAVEVSEETWKLSQRRQETLAELSKSEEHNEALRAVAEKRKPWKS